jgi:chemotaxis signal transduction protein
MSNRALAAPPAQAIRQSFIQIELALGSALLPTQVMIEVISLALTDLVPIPDTPSTVMGVYNWRGDVLWVLDLSALLGQAQLAQQMEQPTLIVVRQGLENLGLVVPQLGQMLWLEAEQMELVVQQLQSGQTAPKSHKSPRETLSESLSPSLKEASSHAQALQELPDSPYIKRLTLTQDEGDTSVDFPLLDIPALMGCFVTDVESD